MTKKISLVVLLVLIAVFVAEIQKYVSQKDQVLTAPVLKENEKQKIIVDTSKRTVTVVKRGPLGRGKEGSNGTQVIKVTEGARKVVITEDNDGSIRVVALNKGFCFEPGLALYYSDKARIGLDVQVAYWQRWGVLLGAGVNMGDEPRTVRAHAGVSYALPLNFIDNTTVFIGIDNKKDAAVGLRIRF